MSIIPSAVHLQMCSQCEEHAHIVFANGERSGTFFSQEVGFMLYAVAQEEGDVSPEECPELLRQIQTSPLPAETQTRDVIEALMFLGKSAEENLDFHELVEALGLDSPSREDLKTDSLERPHGVYGDPFDTLKFIH